jgi:hypothetical protein
MTGDPDLGSLRTDAGLITCQVHDHATRAGLTSEVGSPAVARPHRRLRSPRPPAPERTRLLQVEVEPLGGGVRGGSAVLT